MDPLGTTIGVPLDTPLQEVGAGEAFSATVGLLRASALGSCVAVVIFDAEAGAGGIAHVMLPGSRTGRSLLDGSLPDEGKDYHALDAIPKLVSAIQSVGGNRSRMEAVLAGGADVLRGGEDRIGDQVAQSAQGCLAGLAVPVRARQVGGTERRSVVFHLDSGRVSVTVGDAASELLWQFRTKEIQTDASGSGP